MECGGGSARSDGRGSESGGEASPCKGGAPPAGMEIGEQHAVGVVLGGPGGDRPDCDVRRGCAKRYRTRALLITCESSLLVSFVHRPLKMMWTAKHW
jgi:hypothetical protein